MELSTSVDYLVQAGELPALFVLFFSSIIEYIFPPFPGDTISLGGAVLASAGGWNILLIFAGLTAGSTVGAYLDYLFGRQIVKGRISSRLNTRLQNSRGLEKVRRGYEKWGVALIVVNRFLPGIRAMFFVGAGMARMKALPVVFFAFISAAAWNVLILYLGALLADNIGQLERLMTNYFHVVWVALAALGVYWAVRHWRKSSAD